MTEEKKDGVHSVTNPHSLVAGTGHQRVDLLQSKCFNRFYDGLTIFISIADVTTDIMVLLSYYQQGRMTFFWISLIILLLAQFGYVMVFLFAFDIDDFFDHLWKVLEFICCNFKLCTSATGKCKDFCVRCCIGCVWFWGDTKCGKFMSGFVGFSIITICGLVGLSIGMVFGHVVAFLMYFAENEDSKVFKFLNYYFAIKKRTRIPLQEKLSDQTKFAIDKINKHGGFILEAFMEALPQSILQLVAMVYYKETNIISIGSILLSMTSIMTKSFIISQGVEWKSYLFCWLCVITDFFSIFFIVSWIFLSNDYINGDFLGYFSIVGELWCCKVMISILPPIVLIAWGWCFVAFWLLCNEIRRDNSSSSCKTIFCLLLLFTIFGNIMFAIGFCVFSVVVGLFAEIFCFSIIAAFIFGFLTMNRWDYQNEKTANLLQKMLNFISGAPNRNNDRIIRILCLNYGYYKHSPRVGLTHDSDLVKFIDKRRKEETLNTVSYKDIRQNCLQTSNATIFKTGIKKYLAIYGELTNDMKENYTSTSRRTSRRIQYFFMDIGAIVLLYILVPIYLLSRVFTIIYPYILVSYIFYYDLFFKLDLFELTMLGVYIFLQLIIFVFGFFVVRTHLWLWHIAPGKVRWQANWKSVDANDMIACCYKYYDQIQWLPFAQEIVLQRFGKDIGGIIVEYLRAMSHLDSV